jgi:hypothetical protein
VPFSKTTAALATVRFVTFTNSAACVRETCKFASFRAPASVVFHPRRDHPALAFVEVPTMQVRADDELERIVTDEIEEDRHPRVPKEQ